MGDVEMEVKRVTIELEAREAGQLAFGLFYSLKYWIYIDYKKAEKGKEKFFEEYKEQMKLMAEMFEVVG